MNKGPIALYEGLKIISRVIALNEHSHYIFVSDWHTTEMGAIEEALSHGFAIGREGGLYVGVQDSRLWIEETIRFKRR